jgi:hypothetical protein
MYVLLWWVDTRATVIVRLLCKLCLCVDTMVNSINVWTDYLLCCLIFTVQHQFSGCSVQKCFVHVQCRDVMCTCLGSDAKLLHKCQFIYFTCTLNWEDMWTSSYQNLENWENMWRLNLELVYISSDIKFCIYGYISSVVVQNWCTFS